MIVIIDNYDSFTFNLVQCIGELGYSTKILRNDKTCMKEIDSLNPSHVIISPGPGYPEDAGISLDVIQHFGSKIPILGVCLGHQSIGHVYGGQITQLDKPIHGKISRIYHNNQGIFQEIPSPFDATRYHSLIINKHNLPESLKVTAYTKEGVIMGCQHKEYPNIQGVQFHPESLWTEQGKKIVHNFILAKSE